MPPIHAFFVLVPKSAGHLNPSSLIHVVAFAGACATQEWPSSRPTRALKYSTSFSRNRLYNLAPVVVLVFRSVTVHAVWLVTLYACSSRSSEAAELGTIAPKYATSPTVMSCHVAAMIPQGLATPDERFAACQTVVLLRLYAHNSWLLPSVALNRTTSPIIA